MPADLTSSAIRRSTPLSQQVTQELRRAIVNGDMPPGDALREVALAEQLGVSRVPVREALIELERHGLVEFDDRGRTRVPVLTAQDLEEIYQLRLALEPLAARLASSRADEAAFAAMEENILHTGRVRSIRELSRADADFHDLIFQASGNRRLCQSWEAIRFQVELWLAHMQKQHLAVTHRTRADTVAAHQALLQTLRANEPERAAMEMHEHIIGWRTMLPDHA